MAGGDEVDVAGHEEVGRDLEVGLLAASVEEVEIEEVVAGFEEAVPEFPGPILRSCKRISIAYTLKLVTGPLELFSSCGGHS